MNLRFFAAQESDGFSTKTRSNGFGLHATGLWVQDSGGTIQLESAGCGGASLRLNCRVPVRSIARQPVAGK